MSTILYFTAVLYFLPDLWSPKLRSGPTKSIY